MGGDRRPDSTRGLRIDAAGETEAVEEAVHDTDLGPASADQGTPGHDLARATARRAQVVRDRLAGLSYQEIADKHGYRDKSAARDVVIRALTRVEAKQVEEYRTVENARLDLITLAMTPIMVGQTEKPSDRIAAAGALLRTSERRARLNGLDAPTRVEVTAGAQAMLDDALTELREVVLGEGVWSDDDTSGEDPPPPAVKGR